MQKGFKNEIDFKRLIDNKKLEDLPKNVQNLILSLFNKNLSLQTKVECWQSKYLEKADIKIRINNIIKGVSIKSGNNCSIHQEHIEKITPFLQKIGLEDKKIKILQDFLNGIIRKEKVSGKEYIEEHKEDIELLTESLNNYYIKVNLLIRFIFQGTETQRYDCDAIIFGTPSKFIWATKSEILKYLMDKDIQKTKQIYISNLSLKCYDRNLRHANLKKNKENNIQIKWYSIEKDLLYLTNERYKKLKI